MKEHDEEKERKHENVEAGRDKGRVIFQNTSNRDKPKSLPASINEKSILSNETYKGSRAKAAHA